MSGNHVSSLSQFDMYSGFCQSAVRVQPVAGPITVFKVHSVLAAHCCNLDTLF